MNERERKEEKHARFSIYTHLEHYGRYVEHIHHNVGVNICEC